MEPEKTKCIDCGKEVHRFKRPIMCKPCPACKDGHRCFPCWTKHVEAKVCAYGKAEKMDIWA